MLTYVDAHTHTHFYLNPMLSSDGIVSGSLRFGMEVELGDDVTFRLQYVPGGDIIKYTQKPSTDRGMKINAFEAQIMTPTRVVKANLEGIFRLIKFVCHTRL